MPAAWLRSKARRKIAVRLYGGGLRGPRHGMRQAQCGIVTPQRAWRFPLYILFLASLSPGTHGAELASMCVALEKKIFTYFAERPENSSSLCWPNFRRTRLYRATLSPRVAWREGAG